MKIRFVTLILAIACCGLQAEIQRPHTPTPEMHCLEHNQATHDSNSEKPHCYNYGTYPQLEQIPSYQEAFKTYGLKERVQKLPIIGYTLAQIICLLECVKKNR